MGRLLDSRSNYEWVMVLWLTVFLKKGFEVTWGRGLRLPRLSAHAVCTRQQLGQQMACTLPYEDGTIRTLQYIPAVFHPQVVHSAAVFLGEPVLSCAGATAGGRAPARIPARAALWRHGGVAAASGGAAARAGALQRWPWAEPQPQRRRRRRRQRAGPAPVQRRRRREP